MNKLKVLSISIILILLLSLLGQSFAVSARPQALGISPTLGELLGYSVLGGAAVTNTGATVTDGAVGVSPGTSITGFPPGIAGGIGIQSNTASAIAAQAEALTVFGFLDQPCDFTLGAGLVELGGMSLVPGVYCAGSFGLTGTLTLTGGADEVYIFKSASTIITAPGSLVVGGDPCDIWWRAVSSTTLGSGSSFIGTVVSQTGVNAMNTDANLIGRFIGLAAATVTLDDNTITAPVCLVVVPTATTPADATATATTPADATATATTPADATATATARPPISGLPDTGGAPIQNQAFPWGLLVIAGVVSVVAVALGVQTYRRTHLPKQ